MATAVRIKTNAEMLAEILPALEERARVLTAKGKPVLNDASIVADRELALYFGASLSDVIAAIRRGKGV
jgi:hypothetical protein